MYGNIGGNSSHNEESNCKVRSNKVTILFGTLLAIWLISGIVCFLGWQRPVNSTHYVDWVWQRQYSGQIAFSYFSAVGCGFGLLYWGWKALDAALHGRRAQKLHAGEVSAAIYLLVFLVAAHENFLGALLWKIACTYWMPDGNLDWFQLSTASLLAVWCCFILWKEISRHAAKGPAKFSVF